MPMIHAREFSTLFAKDAISVLANYGFFACQGQQVDVGGVHDFLLGMKALAPMRGSITPAEMAKVLHIPIRAVLNFFPECKRLKGAEKHNAMIDCFAAHKALTQLLGSKCE